MVTFGCVVCSLFVVGFCSGVCWFSFVIGVGLLGLVGGCFHVILFGLL